MKNKKKKKKWICPLLKTFLLHGLKTKDIQCPFINTKEDYNAEKKQKEN